jgi:hypothetical protein
MLLAGADGWRSRARHRRDPGPEQPEVQAAVPDFPAPAGGILGMLRSAALAATGLLVAAASLVSFAESYRGLFEWAHRHGLSGVWSAVWPLQVDVFIAVGELSLFTALVDRWPARSRVLPWTVTLGGLAVSVAGNIGHVAGSSLTSRATAAVPPLAASAAMAVGLGVLKRVVAGRRASQPAVTAVEVPPPAPAPAPLPVPAQSPDTGSAQRPAQRAPRNQSRPRRAPAGRSQVTAAEVADHFSDQIAAGQVPSQRAIRGQWRVGSDRARELHDDVAAMMTAPAAPVPEQQPAPGPLARDRQLQ